MGRMTPSFRQVYEEQINSLRKGFQHSLIDLGRREAFDLLLKEAWVAEQAAMARSDTPTILDALNITANIHNRKLIEALTRRLEEKDQALEELRREVEELKEKLKADSGL